MRKIRDKETEVWGIFNTRTASQQMNTMKLNGNSERSRAINALSVGMISTSIFNPINNDYIKSQINKSM